MSHSANELGIVSKSRFLPSLANDAPTFRFFLEFGKNSLPAINY